MGLIERQYYKRETASLLAPVGGIVELNESQVYGIAKRLVDTFVPDKGFTAFVLSTGYGYWLEAQDNCAWLVTCGDPQPGDASQRKHWFWEARLQVSRHSDLAATQARVELRPTRWRETRDKEFVRKRAYKAFRERLLAELQAASPTFAQVSA